MRTLSNPKGSTDTMERAAGFRKAMKTPRRVIEAELSWIASLLLFFCTVYVAVEFDVLWVVFGIASLSLYVLPIVLFRDPFQAVPWEMTFVLSAPIILHISEGSRMLSENLAWWDDLTSLAFAFSLATIGFILTLELNMFTEVRMNHRLSVFFVVMFTFAVSGFWYLGEYLSDVFFNTSNLTSNDYVMGEFLWISIGGLLMGVVYDGYIRSMPEQRRKTLGFIHLWEVSVRRRS